MIERSEYLIAVCDACGVAVETKGAIAHFKTRDEAIYAARDAGWAVFEYDILCPNCAPDPEFQNS